MHLLTGSAVSSGLSSAIDDDHMPPELVEAVRAKSKAMVQKNFNPQPAFESVLAERSQGGPPSLSSADDDSSWPSTSLWSRTETWTSVISSARDAGQKRGGDDDMR